MKKIYIFAAVIATVITLNACSGGGVFVELNEELKNEYDFYEDSIGSIWGTMGLSQEEADAVFTILVKECGVDEKIDNVSKKNDDNTYTVRVGWSWLEVKLKDNAVETVMRGNEQLYPKNSEKEEEIQEAKEEEEKPLSAYELVSMEGHPVLYDYISTAHEFWDDYAEDRINFDDTYYDYESNQCALSMETYAILERDKKDHMIQRFDIYPNENLSIEQLTELAETYLPMDIMKKWYALRWSDCYYWKKGNSYLYSWLYTPTKKGKKAIEKQKLDYNYAMVIIEIGDEFMPSISILSTNSMPNLGDDYEMIDWNYDFLDK